MNSNDSRRRFLAAGLTLPAAALAAPQLPKVPAAPSPSSGGLAFRTIGKTGLKVTSVGFGCMVTSDQSVVSRAVDMGITYFDTARVYGRGNNERMVGSALKGNRDKVILSSKSTARTAAEAREHLDTSLKELGTDHLDIWYMHFRDDPAAISDEIIPVWEDAKKQGKIRHIGVSTHNPNAIVDRVLQVGKIEVVLSTYNFAIGTVNDPAYERLEAAGIGLVAMKVMAPASRAFGFKTGGEHSNRPGGPLAALKWVLRNKRFGTTVPSMTDAEQLQENFRAMSEPFGAQEEKLLAGINESIRPLYCRMCYRCTGQCPKGAAIPDTIRFLSYADFYGQFTLGREHFAALPDETRAVRCGECESCSVQCPNGVNILERMTRAQELFA
ncbi:MAG TPA: aldo/keto reductase [Bryobacteraceae bacterium]|nr:aldo/keto reductase [Bryobacteraceae bacterium]HPT27194.1 aldo/keto reductase [Bryobacteraceae bacterium]